MFQKVCLFVVYKVILHGKQFLAKQTRRIERNMAKFRRAPVWRMNVQAPTKVKVKVTLVAMDLH